MAQKTLIILEDDIDGGEADETVQFALDGTNYELDLTSKNADTLRGILFDYTAKARKVTGTRGRGRVKGKATGSDAKDIRAWARDKGHDVPDRGRIPADVRDAYEAAN